MAWFQKKNPVSEEIEEVASNEAVSYSIDKARYGRNECRAHLENVLENADRPAKGVVIKLYIANFKRLNEVFGYEYSEKLLNLIIKYLKEKTHATVYRYIGVEFIMILEGLSQGQATALAEEILLQFDNVWKVDDTDCLCSAQIGMCSYTDKQLTVDNLMKFLDMALSKASDNGPNQAVMYDSTLHNQYIRRQTIAMYLKTAIANNEIEVRYRPTFHVEKQRFTRAEYYMRVFVKGIGMIGSAEFLPIAEDSGQIRAIEYFALEQVGACIADLVNAGKEFDSISIPISSVLLLQEDFLDKMRDVIEEYQVPPKKLALEINESALTTAYLNINVVMQELSEMGVELILNDFGSGYTSITSILELPVDTLKLERMFVWQLETNEKSSFIIEGLIGIAKHLNLNIVAEGVETERQVTALNAYGCSYQQGFYYAPTIEKDILIGIMDSTLDESRQTIAEEKEKMKK